ncbi:hypothetical protein C8R47DRAFT_1329500 [Mycena vitilis]|nr:hypothetical protein C8R47DRAFT_1329500 [Mycena vitilis]
METGFLTTHLLSAFFGPTATFLGSKLVKASREDTPLVDSSGRVFGVHSGLNNDPSFQTDVKGAAVAMEEARAKGVATGLFVNWAPNLFDFYTVYTQDFYKTYKHFHRPFLNSVFSACTFNLGPYTCALGHLILWDCKLILEFPPGTTIPIPSAAIFHSNIPISKGEHHYSFTQYTAGGIFRYVDHRYQTEEEYWDSLSAADRKVERANGLERASQGVNMFSTLAELRAMAS